MPVRPMRLSHSSGSLTTAWTEVPVSQGVGQFIRIVNLDAANEVHISFDGGANHFVIRASDPPLQVNALFHRVYLKSDVTADYNALLGAG